MSSSFISYLYFLEYLLIIVVSSSFLSSSDFFENYLHILMPSYLLSYVYLIFLSWLWYPQ